MSATTETATQKIVSFTSEGSYNSVQKSVAKVTEDLAIYLARAKNDGENPVVISISQTSGFIGHVGFYASLTAVISI